MSGMIGLGAVGRVRPWAVSVALVVAALSVGQAAAKPGAGAAARVESRRFRSAAVAQRRGYLVFLPPGYEEASAPLPVVYLLHGLGGAPRDWQTYAHVGEVAARLIRAGTIAPLVLVAPDGGDAYWTDHYGEPHARWGAFVAEDLIAEVQRRYRVRTDPGGRAIVGVSMGGHGALSVALSHPTRFAAAASLSGALFPTPPTHRRIYKRVWGDPADEAHWRATSPIALITALTPASSPPALYLQCGDDDLRTGFLDDALLADRLLRERHIPHELRISDGGHSWRTWAGVTEDWLRFVDQHWR